MLSQRNDVDNDVPDVVVTAVTRDMLKLVISSVNVASQYTPVPSYRFWALLTSDVHVIVHEGWYENTSALDWMLPMPPFEAVYMPVGTTSTRSAARFLAIQEKAIWRRVGSTDAEDGTYSHPVVTPSVSAMPSNVNPGHPMADTNSHVDVISDTSG